MASSSDDLSGYWLAEMYAEHLPEHLAFDEGLIQSVLKSCHPGNALDLGCGAGYFVQWLREHEVDAWGAEPSDLGAVFRAPGYQIHQDISQPFDLQRTYDLIICTEVVEHIPKEFENIVFDNIVKHVGKYLVFSGATPEQGGSGHINEEPESYWFSHLARRGLQLVLNASISARLASTLSWYQNNISIWEPTALSAKEVRDTCDLKAIVERDRQLLNCQVMHQRFVSQAHTEIESLKADLATRQGHVSWFQSKFSQTQSELAGSQTQLAHSQEQLAHSQEQLAQSQSHLAQCQGVLAHSQAKLFQTQEEINGWRDRAEQEQILGQEVRTRLQTRLTNKRNQLKRRQDELQSLQNQISAMQTSKFWKLRRAWLKIKKTLGFSVNE